jgi:rubrerythrin
LHRAKKAEEEAYQTVANHLDEIRQHNSKMADSFAQMIEKLDKVIDALEYVKKIQNEERKQHR